MTKTLRYVIVRDCWEFTGYTDEDGYGIIRKTQGERKAHRLMYKRTHTDFDKNLQVQHTCNNPPCINPTHLTQGTPKENSAYMVESGRHRGRRFITDEMIDDMRGLRELGWTQQRIADFMGISNQAVSLCLRRGVE